MTEQQRTALKDLQKLDTRILEIKERIQSFDPLFEEVEEPVLVLESELGTLRKRSQEMKLEERRLELSIDEKKDRLKKLEERLGSVRNLREEAAVSAELEMIKRALQNDEQEAFTLLDQIRKSDERIEELDAAFEEARSMVEPKKEKLLAERSQIKDDLESLRAKRDSAADDIDDEELRIYDAIRGRTGRQAVAALTEDGACGNCYGMVPLQVQNEIRHGARLIRCEACGVILTAPEPEAPEEEAKAAADDTAADGADGGDDASSDTPDEALVEE